MDEGMAPALRKRKLDELVNEEQLRNGYVAGNSSLFEEFDPNLQADSCGPQDEEKRQEHEALPDIHDLSVAGRQRKRKSLRKSSGNDCLTKMIFSSDGDSNQGPFQNKQRHGRKSSAPALSVRSSSPVGHSRSGINKKLILKKSVLKTNGVLAKPVNGSRIYHDSVPASVVEEKCELQNKAERNNNGPQYSSDDSKKKSPPSTRTSPRGASSCKEDFDDNLVKDSCDSDNDLPDVLAWSPENPSDQAPIKKNDPIWVKFQRYPHWPAIVKNLHMKKKKIRRVIFVFIGDISRDDIRANAFSLNYRPGAILPFGGKNHQNLKQKGLETAYAAQLRIAVEKTEDYLLRKVGQPDLDIWEFFKFDMIPGFGQSLSGSQERDERKDIQRLNFESENDELDFSNEETSSGSEAEEPVSHSSGCLPETPEEIRLLENRRNERIKRYINFMKTKRMQDHLCKVKDGATDSEFQKRFFENAKKAYFNSYFGPIIDDEQQDEVMSILSGIYKTAYNADPRALLENRNYLISVWVPEAIIFSIMKVQHCNKEKAMEILQKGPHLTKAEYNQRHTDIISAATELTEEQVKSSERKYQNTMKKLKRKRNKWKYDSS